jgi:DNA-binding XRE family transcriptional regulator
MLERRDLDLGHAELARASRAVVRAGQLDALHRLSYWLCTHWPTCRRMAAVTPEERLAANLRKHRRAARLTQEQLSAKAGLHPTEISRLERAVRDPRLSTIVSVARGLGVTAEQLVAGIR